MPKGEYLFDASKPMLKDFYEDMYSNLPEDILREFVATLAIQHSIFELQALCEKHTEMGEVIKTYAMRPMIQKDFGEKALTIYDKLIQQDKHKDLSLSKYYQFCKKLKEEMEQLREFINSEDMKFATALEDWPTHAAAELSDLNNFFDKTINEHYKVLITYLARPGLQDYRGITPLHCAAYNGHFATVKALLGQPGIDVNKADNSGNTPLIWAAGRGHLETVKVLLAWSGVDVNKANHVGGTPLNWAALFGHLETVKALLAQPGIDVNKADNAGMPPLNTAALFGHLETVKVLLAQPGIDVNKADNDGRTPLYWAELQRYEEIALLIKTHIATKNTSATAAPATPGYAALHNQTNQTTVNNGAVNTSNSNNFSMT